MAIFRRYAAMFRVGTSFIFSSIKSRSASVTLNLICTVLLRPFMYSLLSFPFRGFGTLPNKQFSTDAPQRGRGKYGSGYTLPMLATNVFIPYALLRSYARFCQTSAKEKRCNPQKKITTLSKSCSVLSRTFLFALFFDFGNLLCRCGYNPYACIAHTVKKRVKLPPLRVLLRRRF